MIKAFRERHQPIPNNLARPMGIQSRDLVMIGLGVEHDSPPDGLQARLLDGVHLRWAFDAARGFPWHGYYLLRRRHQGGEIRCLAELLARAAAPYVVADAGLPLGSARMLNTATVAVGDGHFESDASLVLTDEFTPGGVPELDLRGRTYLRFTFNPDRAARYVRYRIGLYKAGNRGSDRMQCVGFEGADVSSSVNPRREDEVDFRVLSKNGQTALSSRVAGVNGRFALATGYALEAGLPCNADEVWVLLFSGTHGGEIFGLDAKGKTVARTSFAHGGDEPVRVGLRGRDIATVRIVAPQGRTWLVTLCFHCTGQDAKDSSPVRVRAFSGATLLAEHTIAGPPGGIVNGAFTFDHITRLECLEGNAALVDLCYETVASAARGQWEPVPQCPQPLCLPVRHPSYPCSGNQPLNVAAAEGTALGRVTHGNAAAWGGPRFAQLHDLLIDLVGGGPGGPSMHLITRTTSGVTVPPNPDPAPRIEEHRPLHLVTLGALFAPVAEMLGLYWVDRAVRHGERFDYIVVADHSGQFTDVADVQAFLAQPLPNWTLADGWIVFDKGAEPAPPMNAPRELAAYALPGSTWDTAAGDVRDGTNNAGLVWDLQRDPGGQLVAGAPVLHYIWRAGGFANRPVAPVPGEAHAPVTRNPQLIGRPVRPAGVVPERPSDWPPLELAFTDMGLAEGWYSYRVTGIDLFGRHSPRSDPAHWLQWAPAPIPRPWYFDPVAVDGVVHPFAIGLLDKIPPPPPTGVEAFALDPRDPTVLRDTAFAAWHATLTAAEQNATIGLRVRWTWTYAHMRQAPDLAEFRVYFEPGQLNTLTGRIDLVAAAGAGYSLVTTNMPNTSPADAYIGAYLRSRGVSFKIVGSDAGAPLRVRVQHPGPAQSEVPLSGSPAVIAIPPGTLDAPHPLYLDFKRREVWADRLWVVAANAFVAEGVVPAPAGANATLAGTGAAVAGTQVTLPAGVDLAGVRAYTMHVWLAADAARPSRIYRITVVDATNRRVTLEAAPALAAVSSDWEIGTYVRRYEIFLPYPADGDRAGLSLKLATSASEPVAYANVGVSAVDDKTHTADDPARAGRWAGRTGNEGSVGGPSMIFRVHRDPPPAPAVPPDAERVYASRADYQDRSYFTFRWVPLSPLFAHVFRAMDASLFDCDWSIRETRTALSAGADRHGTCFPSGWTQARKQAAVAVLAAVAAPGDYAGLSADARLVLARLPGNESRAWDAGLQERDWSIRHTRANLTSADAAFFPPDWNAARGDAAAAPLNALQARTDYRALGNNARRILAGLPGNERAFAQQTIDALNPDDPANANRRGPDNSAGLVLDPALRAYVDTLDGRSSNLYFYRAAYVDAAHNLGPMSLSSPPVYLPDMLPPRAPVFTRVTAGDADAALPGDAKITLRWASNREDDLVEYRVLRTADAVRASDVRKMQLVHTRAVPAGGPAARPAQNVWVDDTVQGLVTYHYRLVAVDTAGNHSAASVAIAARAYDTRLPDAPALALAWSDQAGVRRVEVQWDSPHRLMLQRRRGAGAWSDLPPWRDPGPSRVRDEETNAAHAYEYRTLVRSATGAVRRGPAQPIAASVPPS